MEAYVTDLLVEALHRHHRRGSQRPRSPVIVAPCPVVALVLGRDVHDEVECRSSRRCPSPLLGRAVPATGELTPLILVTDG